MLFNEHQLKAIRGALFIRAQSMGDIANQNTQEAIIAYESTHSAIAVIDALIRGDVIASPWWIDDVHALFEEDGDPELTDAEARRVLALSNDDHDASIGINWDVLRDNAHYVLEQRDEDPNGGDGDDD